ncbi:hypothetical protein CGZ75_02385 [Paenibacillus herberti]|uniref:Uncharacterized protein n=1 Tax=Paenibacillus herberti TaxID=1619309 RepID=A0A229P0P1_9BACL|nr:hypothetical protein CGZ75_02385 [Paenibacillus herberti]
MRILLIPVRYLPFGSASITISAHLVGPYSDVISMDMVLHNLYDFSLKAHLGRADFLDFIREIVQKNFVGPRKPGSI